MAHYIGWSTRIYDIYIKHVAPEDIHVYSIYEVFMDATDYISTSGLSASDFAMRIILDVLNETGITATAGIGTNLYLSKVAMDIGANMLIQMKTESDCALSMTTTCPCDRSANEIAPDRGEIAA